LDWRTSIIAPLMVIVDKPAQYFPQVGTYASKRLQFDYSHCTCFVTITIVMSRGSTVIK